MLAHILVVIMQCDPNFGTGCISFQEFETFDKCEYAKKVIKDYKDIRMSQPISPVKFAWCVKK